MRKIIPIVVVALMLAICIVVPAESSDASDARTDSFRISNSQLFHFQSKALDSATIDLKNVFIYEAGQDTSMKNYIENHSLSPEKGTTSITKDTTYEVYYFGDVNLKDHFTVPEKPTMALDVYKYDFVVEKDTTHVVKMTKISAAYYTGSLGQALTIKNDKSDVTYTLAETLTVKVGYIEGSTYSILPTFSNDALFYDGTMETNILHYDASPLPFIIISIAIVVLIGALVAYCGRKPKFD